MYQPFPPNISAWDILNRKWRPLMILTHSKWALLAANPIDKNCIARDDIEKRYLAELRLPCDDNFEVYHLLEKHFNISIYSGLSPDIFLTGEFNTIQINIAFHDYPESLERVPRMSSTYIRHILYCRAVAKFESTWTVWFTPYDYHCWIAVCITICLLPIIWMIQFNFKKWWFYYAKEIYFLTSIAIRQPIRSYPTKYVLFVFAMLILSSGYESLITMKLILPSELFKIDHVGEFFKVWGYSKIVYDGSLDAKEYDITANDTDIREEFKKHGLTKILRKVFHIIKGNNIPFMHIPMHAWKNSSIGQLFYLEEYHGNLELYVATTEARVQVKFKAELGQEMKCRSFPIGGIFHGYAVIYADYSWEIDRVLRHVLGESGLRTYWAKFWRQTEHMKIMTLSMEKKRKTQNLEGEGFILLSSLAKFFAIWGVTIGVAGIMWVYEMQVFVRERCNFSDFVSRCRKVLSLINGYVCQKEYFCC